MQGPATKGSLMHVRGWPSPDWRGQGLIFLHAAHCSISGIVAVAFDRLCS